MPGFLVQAGAVVTCSHGGQAQPTTVQPRVRLSGAPLLPATTVHTVAGCSFTPPQGNGPCVSAQWVGAVRVRASGVPVLLADSRSVCTPTGTPLVVTVTQQRVRGI
ncbi:hypothetical protein [Actinophytocola oryzae]|uniref:DUF4280 domain-containing protein n=1 Tax=Actinophytocola oryzae TaxID=502181 RepID=A0A4R7VHF0_9PSEU|nr:hypothetical protein [Actinophytocola oryzae]TDV48766.1 hypothetical protein CLV71_108126 [Actinophytocola oryzae]